MKALPSASPFPQNMLPLMNTLLSVSQKDFFLEHWTSFLNLCLANIKQRDANLLKISLSGVVRMVWVYCVRIKGEGNIVTEKKLRTVCDALFPPRLPSVFPRDEPTYVFSRTILYMAQVCKSFIVLL
jgi:hypothetical protein